MAKGSRILGMSIVEKGGFQEWLVRGRALWTNPAPRGWFFEVFKQLWPAYLLASLLILCGFHWSLPNAYQDKSFQADGNGAVWAVNQIHFPHLNLHWFG